MSPETGDFVARNGNKETKSPVSGYKVAVSGHKVKSPFLTMKSPETATKSPVSGYELVAVFGNKCGHAGL